MSGDKAGDVEERLLLFGVRVLRLIDAMPETAAGKHVGKQVLRSGTSPAPNYAEARAAESDADFVHKLKIALKELNETHIWLRMMNLAELVKAGSLEDLIDENKQLCRILAATIRTTKERMENERQSKVKRHSPTPK